MKTRIFNDKQSLGKQAAAWCAGVLNDVIKVKGRARLILATGASQFEFLDEFVKLPIRWDKITCFHLDEYVGLDETHPASFRRYLKDRVWNIVKPSVVHTLDPESIQSYSRELQNEPIDLACIGIGENGHIAFNDPPVANFDDPELVKIVKLEEACRLQQVGEGWFKDLLSTPTHAATLTIPAIMSSQLISVVVPDQRKAKAVKAAIEGPICTSCPASILRQHDNVMLWLDEDASSLLTKSLTPSRDIDFPGFVDLQVNGYLGVDFSSIHLDESSCRHAFRSLITLAGYVVFMPTVITSPFSTYQHVLPLIGFRGMHPKQLVLPADINTFQELNHLANYNIKLLTLAAEIEGAVTLCEYASAQGIIVCLGHQEAAPENIVHLKEAGAKLFTHLGNGMPERVHRHDNALMVALGTYDKTSVRSFTSPMDEMKTFSSIPNQIQSIYNTCDMDKRSKLYVSVIADGHHLPAHVLCAILNTVDEDKLVLVSDMSPVSGLAPGRHTFAGVEVALDPNERLHLLEHPEYLAGSATSLLGATNFLLRSNIVPLEKIRQLVFDNPLHVIGKDPSTVAECNTLFKMNSDGRIELIDKKTSLG